MSSSGSSSGDCEVIMPGSEPDNKRKSAEIYLAKAAMNSSSGGNNKEGDEGTIPHWAICVYFPEYEFWVQMEGVHNSGKLRSCYSKDEKKPSGKLHKFKDATILGFSARFPDIFEITVSPQDLYRISKFHPYDGKPYNILSMRCYEWALEAARIISEQFG